MIKGKFRFGLILLMSFLFLRSMLAIAQDLTIGNYRLIEEKRVGRTEFEYTYRADVTNTGLAVRIVNAAVTSSSPHTIIMDGTLTFRNIGDNDTKTGSDTFTFRHDRLVPFDFSVIVWTVQVPFQISIPSNGTVSQTQPITVAGFVPEDTTTVKVNGVPATVRNGLFIADVPLSRNGNHIITAVATDAIGKIDQDSISIGLDTEPPILVIDTPLDGLTTADEFITIAGTVSDAMTTHPVVIVNDVAAMVDNGHFIAMNVSLNAGANLITATATDDVGNMGRSNAISVNRAAQPGLRLKIISGQAQSGSVSTPLPGPLTAQLVDAADKPVSNREVLFQVVRGDGELSDFPSIGRKLSRILRVKTDENGQVEVRFTLGSRNGAGNNRVQANVKGSLSFVEFCATATSRTPNRITIIATSNQQKGVVGRTLTEPFAALVTDEQGNPVADVSVRFEVVEGGGNLDGNVSLTVNTGPDGIARALLTLGSESGTQNNVVTATFKRQTVSQNRVTAAQTEQTNPQAQFVASGVTLGPEANTTFRGIVLDNSDQPLQNARAVIEGTDRESFTDEAGRFRITDVPPGSQRLFIDSSTVNDPPRVYPDLEFDVNVISGADNSLPAPIYLPPLADAVVITGTETEPMTLQMPGVQEATLTILPGSVRREDGSLPTPNNPIHIRFSRVNNERVPMPPPNGSTFMLAWTVQPAGTQFDPPAAICIPNAGMPPGSQVDIFSFNHDVGQFLNIGLATVNDDGSTICSNPGFGIRKAGWGGCTPPPPPTTDPKNCTVNMTAYRPQKLNREALELGRFAVPDDQEENRGAGIRFNGDDNNENLIEVELRASLTSGNGVRYFLKRSNPNITVWETPHKLFEILFDQNSGDEAEINFSQNTQTVWVENIAIGSSLLELKGRSEEDSSVVCSDRIRFYTFTSIVIGLSGETQIFGGDPLVHGTFDISRDLYQRGYDVTYYDESKASTMYDEVVNAIQNRDVSQVAIFGYSHGGGSTHDLAERLNNNIDNIGTFTISYTAYIDAVAQPLLNTTPENRRPPGTAFHVNYFQENGAFELGGGPVADAHFECDVTNKDCGELPPGWGADLTHSDIHKHPNVIAGIISRLISRVTP